MKMDELIARVESAGRQTQELSRIYQEYLTGKKALNDESAKEKPQEFLKKLAERGNELYEILEGYTDLLVQRGVFTYEERCSALDDMRMRFW